MMVLSGCSAYQQMSDYREFQALCEREAGLHIYKKVKADEIFNELDGCGTLCAITLIDSQALNRIGFCSSQYFGPFPDRKPPGCYVFEKGMKGDAACYAEMDGAFRSHRNKDFFKTQCVKILPMKEKFRYRSIFSRKVDIVNDGYKTAIIKNHGGIYDANDNSALLDLKSFYFVPKDYSYGRENYSTKRCKNAYKNPHGGVSSSDIIDMVFK
jgi:hypothetical protein